MSVLRCVRAEWLKLRKRPAVWILTGTFALVVLLLGYLLLYTVVTQAPPEASVGIDRVLVLTVLSPENLPGQVLSMTASFGGALGLILGALAVGGEFSWRTVKTTTTQQPRRTTLLGGQALALALVCLVLAVAAFAGGAVGAYTITLLEPIGATPPPVADLLTGLAVAWLLVAVWCAIGMCLAMLFRGAGWAIGIGLLYAFAVEQVLTLLPLQGGAADLLEDALLSTNANALVTWLSPEATQALGGTTVDIAPLQSVLVLLAYVVVAVLVAMGVFARRDIA